MNGPKNYRRPCQEVKYTKSFALYVGGDEVYEKDKADALEAELKPLVGGPHRREVFKYDTDPAHNPQPPCVAVRASADAPFDMEPGIPEKSS